jgi:hypothetical protein
MHILIETDIDWRKRRLISKLYMDQSVKIRLDKGETKCVNIRRKVKRGYCLFPTVFNLHNEYFNETLERYGDFEICGEVVRTVKFADGLG